MREIGAVEAKNKFDTVLSWVAQGEEVLITRHGKAIARIVPAVADFDRAKAKQAAIALLAASRGLSLGNISVKELVNEGRR